jgi:hypothetical protein
MSKKKKPIKIVDDIRSDEFDYMKTVKNNLDRVIMNKDVKPIIVDLVHRTNKLVIHAYQFIKLYCIHCIRNNTDLPFINKDYIMDVFKVISVRSDNSGNSTKITKKEHMEELKNFYKNHYSKTIYSNEEILYDKLSYILQYEAIDMITNINNNIQMNFIKHLYRYINIRLEIKERSAEITSNNPGSENKDKRKTLHKALYDETNKVKYDIISLKKKLTSHKTYHELVLDLRKILFPEITKFNRNIHYDIKVNPQKYLFGMFYISMHIEIINLQLPPESRKHRLFNIMPLRTNIIAKNICIDTPALIMNFIKEDKGWYLKNYKELDLYNELWRKIFKIDNRSFKKNEYKFSNMVRTDGVSCCILFVKTDDNGNPRPKKFSDFSEDINPEYIDTIKLTSETKAKQVVCVDPGHSDLIYCGAWNKPMYITDLETNKKIKYNKYLDTFRYTQNQRRSETKSKKYNKILDTRSKETIIKGENKSVKEIETELSKYNSKSSFYWKFFDYLLQKNKTNFKLHSYYEDRLFRKLKLNRYTNTQKSESKMVNNFKAKFGEPDKTIFVIGDYDKGSYHMRGLEPAICKKFRRIFKNAGYETFLINEYKTSKVSNCCKGDLEKFRYYISKKPKNKGQETLCHGLLRCQSVKQKCETIHNRDKNAVINMLAIVHSIYRSGTRPNIFTRTESSQISLALSGV